MHILNLYFGNDCPHSFFEALLYYTGIGWWIHCMFECGNSVYYEWYIPTLLVFYFLFPYFENNNIIRTIIIFCMFNFDFVFEWNIRQPKIDPPKNYGFPIWYYKL